MKVIRRSVLLLVVLAGAYCIVPLFLMLIGAFNMNYCFHRPQSARITVFHVDHNIKDELGVPSIRITSVLKTDELPESEIFIHVDFLHRDGAPVLSRIDQKEIKVSKMTRSLGNDILNNVIIYIPYNVFPKECYESKFIGKVYLSYVNRSGVVIKQKQKKFRIKRLNRILDDAVSDCIEDNTIIKQTSDNLSNECCTIDNEKDTTNISRNATEPDLRKAPTDTLPEERPNLFERILGWIKDEIPKKEE